MKVCEFSTKKKDKIITTIQIVDHELKWQLALLRKIRNAYTGGIVSGAGKVGRIVDANPRASLVEGTLMQLSLWRTKANQKLVKKILKRYTGSIVQPINEYTFQVVY